MRRLSSLLIAASPWAHPSKHPTVTGAKWLLACHPAQHKCPRCLFGSVHTRVTFVAFGVANLQGVEVLADIVIEVVPANLFQGGSVVWESARNSKEGQRGRWRKCTMKETIARHLQIV